MLKKYSLSKRQKLSKYGMPYQLWWILKYVRFQCVTKYVIKTQIHLSNY